MQAHMMRGNLLPLEMWSFSLQCCVLGFQVNREPEERAALGNKNLVDDETFNP